MSPAGTMHCQECGRESLDSRWSFENDLGTELP
jgi:hypothetical protein